MSTRRTRSQAKAADPVAVQEIPKPKRTKRSKISKEDEPVIDEPEKSTDNTKQSAKPTKEKETTDTKEKETTDAKEPAAEVKETTEKKEDSGQTGGSCTQIDKVDCDMTMYTWFEIGDASGRKLPYPIWTCGMEDPKFPSDHSKHVGDESLAAMRVTTEAIKKQIRSWGAADDSVDGWNSYLILKETLDANKIPAGTSIPDIIGIMFGLDKHKDFKMHDQGMNHARKTFFPQRFYWIGTQIDTKKLSKVKAGTNLIKNATVKDSVHRITVEHPGTSTFDRLIFIAGWAKKAPGSVLVTTYIDGSEDHYYYGKA
eukprot:TRINITY_DN4624_c0_g1_i1.p1 TRINITY_DN4624_c0_g1~~TRINITY_DN4624_c0_g1_i1.p1  ORF type:complete len:313 (-),score=60.40 TRINITY_DN4624_c0_g1_i1:107-1045(-)